jgi:hypothetical protein
MMLVSSPALALDEASSFAEWVKSSGATQSRLAEDVVEKFVASGGYDALLLEAKTARKRGNAELSEFAVVCMNKMNAFPPDDPGANDIKIPIGDLIASCIETSLYN